MAVGDFVWCDLSTLRLETTRPFYRDLFGWDYSVNQLPDGSDYTVAASSAGEAAGIFEMPRKFQEMKLPSFWMGYIEVGDADAAVASARENGGKVELGPVPFQDGARIALIRDPLGAGFTVIENSGLPVRSDNALEGSMIWNALYVSDAAQVISFYEHLFGWRFKPLSGVGETYSHYQILNSNGRHVADLVQAPEAIRGSFEFWGIHFSVADRDRAKAIVEAKGGAVLYEDDDAVLVQDPDGAAFFVAVPKAGVSSEDDSVSKSPFRYWKPTAALAVLWGAFLLDQSWVWGLIFLAWAIPALRTGETHLIEPVRKRETPVLFWSITLTWIILSAAVLIYGL